MTQKHSQGPWTVNWGMRPPRIGGAESAEVTIVDMPHWDIDHWGERTANTHLIAAAPDLLEALECLVHRCEAEGCGTAWAPMTAAREAISKALGEVE